VLLLLLYLTIIEADLPRAAVYLAIPFKRSRRRGALLGLLNKLVLLERRRRRLRELALINLRIILLYVDLANSLVVKVLLHNNARVLLTVVVDWRCWLIEGYVRDVEESPREHSHRIFLIDSVETQLIWQEG